MPTRKATCCELKTVSVTVYLEKPRRKVSSKHHHYLHHTIIKQELIRHEHGGTSKGYSRRAQLLHYSRHLRESARSSASKALQSKPVSSIDQRKPSNIVVAVQRKTAYSRTAGCFDKWRMVVPSFRRCLTNVQAKRTGKEKKDIFRTSKNMLKAIMKSLQVQKKWRFFTKPISMLHKNRHR